MRYRSVVASGIAVLLVIGVPATASARIIFTRIQYDPPGSDTGSNRHLNKEFVVIKNTGRKKNLKGWRIRDEGSIHVYKFRNRFVLRRGRFVTIHTGRGNNDRNDRFWGQSNYVWNNDGDTATLVKPSGRTGDQCGYSGGGRSRDCN